MPGYLIDTDVIIHAPKGNLNVIDALDGLGGGANIAFSVISEAELYVGVAPSSQEAADLHAGTSPCATSKPVSPALFLLLRTRRFSGRLDENGCDFLTVINDGAGGDDRRRRAQAIGTECGMFPVDP